MNPENQNTLSENIDGKIYEHTPFCNGDRTKPKGGWGCICLKNLVDDENPDIYTDPDGKLDFGGEDGEGW